MIYLAITEPTATWLSERPSLRDALCEILTSDKIAKFSDGDFYEGSIRLAFDADSQVLALWNTEYLSGTGDEPWGFIRLTGPASLNSMIQIATGAFKREVRAISLRLRGLLLESDWEGKTKANGAHTLIAGDSRAAFKQHLAYIEKEVAPDDERIRSRTILFVGPEHRWETVSSAAADAGNTLPDLVISATTLVYGRNRRRKLLANDQFPELRSHITPLEKAQRVPFRDVTLPSRPLDNKFATRRWGYEQWNSDTSPLTPQQRRILDDNALSRHPIRIIGPAGSGKTLLMQLLAIKQLREHNPAANALYVVHNTAMEEFARQRFLELSASDLILPLDKARLRVSTLAEFAADLLELDSDSIIDTDAYISKQWQLERIEEALRDTFNTLPKQVNSSGLLQRVNVNDFLLRIFAELVRAEISTAIKGHGIGGDIDQYVKAPRALSRLHRVLSEDEKVFVFRVYEKYQDILRGDWEFLDSDDVAISLLARFRSPVWDLRRKREGFDYVFVDEAQLFNENERRLFPLLCKSQARFAPIALALDDAQEFYGQTSSGLGSLGLRDVESTTLPFNHRSTRNIVELAFYIIEKTTDLFGTDFPDFTSFVELPESSDGDPRPGIVRQSPESQSFGASVRKVVRELHHHYDGVAVICHSDKYWPILENEFKKAEHTDLAPVFLLERGKQLQLGKKSVVVTQPPYVGGQEFDLVILIGLEEGLVPPRVLDNDPLGFALEQQSLRELYLSVTRSRKRVVFVIAKGSNPSPILADAIRDGVVVIEEGI